MSFWWSPGAAAPCVLQENTAKNAAASFALSAQRKGHSCSTGPPPLSYSHYKAAGKHLQMRFLCWLGREARLVWLPQTVLPALPSSGSELPPRHLLLWALWLLLPSRGRERHEVGLAQPDPLVGFIPDPLGPQLFWSQRGRGCAGRKRHFQQGVTPSSLSPRKGSSAERRQGFRHLLWSLCYPPPSQLSKLQP